MKHLLLLLIIPTLSYSQTFEDIMNMTSERNFKITMIENDYQKLTEHSSDSMIVYGLNYSNFLDIEKVDKMGIYRKHSNMNLVMITDTEKIDYKTITEKVKKDCEFDDVMEFKGYDYLTYNCPQSKGIIGFTVTESGGEIINFHKPTEE